MGVAHLAFHFVDQLRSNQYVASLMELAISSHIPVHVCEYALLHVINNSERAFIYTLAASTLIYSVHHVNVGFQELLAQHK